MTYDATRREKTPPLLPDVTYQQSDIRRLAARFAIGTVDGARTSQHVNGDHPNSTYNYLRAVGVGRRLSSASDFEGERALPWELYPYNTPIARWKNPAEEITFGTLIDWVLNVYSDWALTFPSAQVESKSIAPSSPRPLPPGSTLTVPQAPGAGFTIDSAFGPVSFIHAPLRFDSETYIDAFARLRPTITLRSVLAKPRYAKLRSTIEQVDSSRLDAPLGSFLQERKARGDAVYQQFLNPWGDRTYKRFSLDAPEIAHQRGVYAFAAKGVVKYIGRSRDPFRTRIDQGYGYIAPRACFSDGQSTNCKVNSHVTATWPDVDYFVHVEDDEDRIIALETDLIARYQPEWNGRGP